MNATGIAILEHLRAVEAERAARRSDPALGAACLVVKERQHERFVACYTDVLATPRWGDAARFFLEDLYGPGDFSRRDSEFARVVPSLVRLFPTGIVQTVATLGELHALSERLDTAMARAWPDPADRADDWGVDYGHAWRAVGQPEARQRQIALMLDVGRALDRYTRNPVLRHSLRLMRGPAQVAGLGELQSFLENGFDTFSAMKGAEPFLGMIAQRESSLVSRLFAGQSMTVAVKGLPGRL